jgi:hypothetical protein
VCASAPLSGQYLGLNLRGDAGMKSGSQPAPGVYFIVPLYYRSDYSSLRDQNGNKRPGDTNLSVDLLAPVVAATTKVKILGATYGAQLVPIFMNQRLSVAEDRRERENAFGFADLYVQPINLGWRTKRADFLAAYGFFAPTGSGTRTLDMWAHELVAGTTIYFDDGKSWHAAGTMFYDINQRKQSEDIKVGNYLTIEGGVGRSFLKGAANAGLAYVLQWKVTDDKGSGVNPRFAGHRNKAYGLGPELNMPFFAKGTLVGLIGFRYTFEAGNSTNFQGNNLVFSVTLAKLSAQ